MKPALTADEDLEWLFDHAVEELQHRFGYSAIAAEALTRDYYQRFRDPEYCKSIRLRVQNDELFFHEGPGEMALLIHYYLGIKGDPDRDRYIDWRTQYFKDLRSAGQKRAEDVAVLIEGLSVVIRYPAIETAHQAGARAFALELPNRSWCEDGELARVGFLPPEDVRGHVEHLESWGLKYLNNRNPVEIAVVPGASRILLR